MKLLILALIVLLSPVAPAAAGSDAVFPITRRVRREWRSLSQSERQKAAVAMWIMKLTSTEEGSQKYGPRFRNHDVVSLLHACAVRDPRCDQGHYGPQFTTFHRSVTLLYENSLLTIDHALDAEQIKALHSQAHIRRLLSPNDGVFFSWDTTRTLVAIISCGCLRHKTS